MSEQILKFQPNRSIYLRGFDGRGACAALYDTTANSFKVSGVFRDASDFAVLVIRDVDDTFLHSRLKPLPDGKLTGMVLEFDMHYSGLQPIDSPKYPTIDWPYLDVARTDGSTAQIKLHDHATPVGSGPVAATNVFGIGASGFSTGDTLTLWYQNVSWTYSAAGGEPASAIESNLAAQINATDWASVGGSYKLVASAAGGGGLTITADPAGYDGNMIRIYSVASNPAHLNATPTPLQLSGGSSDVTWHVTLDFTALGIDDVRQLWLTFAPQLADSAAYVDTNWDATFTNWGITADPHNLKALQVAGPGSVRVEESDAWCTYSGSSWTPIYPGHGWFSKGLANVATAIGDSVTVTYWCGSSHDLYLGTSVYSDRGIFSVSIDGGAAIAVDTYLGSQILVGGVLNWIPAVEAVSTRRKIASGVASGQHTVTLTVASNNGHSLGNYCYFDFLEAAIPSDVPDAPGTWSDRSPAIDYDTLYNLSPEQMLWIFDKLGFTGPMNEYIGVFWWYQLKVTGQTYATATVTIGSGFVPGDSIFLNIGGTTIGKSVFAHENSTIWAAHFAYFINETFSGIWASASGNVLTVQARSETSAYQITPFTASVTSALGTATVSGLLNNSVAGTWVVDPTQSPAFNYAAQCWHQALFAQVQMRGNTVVCSFSLEVVNPPDNPGGGQVWAARFPDNSQVLTGTVAGTLTSLQCAPMATAFLNYQKAVFLYVAQLQDAAGLTPQLQFGEFLWWFFSRLWFKPIGYISFTNPITIGMPAPHGLTTGQNIQIFGAEGCTSANGTFPVTVTDATHFTIPVAASGAWVTGTGMLNGGGMAYCDAETNAAATTALGHTVYFDLPTSDPSLNSYADANFVANRLNQHADAIQSYVQATYPAAVFEILLALDVNNIAQSTGPSLVGGQLNNYVSFPQQWRSHTTAPFKLFKLEQLAWGTTDRNMDLVKAGLATIRALDWPIAQLRYLYPIDNPGVAQDKEYTLGKQAGFQIFTPFAIDHIGLMNWDVEPPVAKSSARLL